MNSSPVREEAIFTLALGKSAAECGAFLDRECGDDVALRQRLNALLAAHEQKNSVLATKVEAAARPTLRVDVPDEPPDEAVGQTLGRYKLLEKIGEGGCGVVYVAEQTEPVRRRVALKIIKLGMDTKQVVARFEAERQALAMMDHPNIAKILDAGVTEVGGRRSEDRGQSIASPDPTSDLRRPSSFPGRPYFVMELVRGIRITDYCDQANLTTQERLDLFIKVCQAIQHAHQKGIIHRDIKPSNILVTLHDGVPVPKVIDFGIAKATEGRLTDATVYTQLHQFIGTPAYMSPEQAEMSGLDIDTRSDIYSLGVLLYELLAGSTPFDAKDLIASGIDAMRKTIREKEPERPSTRLAALKGEELTTTARRRSSEAPKLIHQLQGDLDWIAIKCLEKDRARRYETANGLAADLKRHLDNEPVVARPPSTAYRAQKAWRRNRLAFAAAAAVAGALTVGLGISTWQAVRAKRAERVALAAQLKESQSRMEADAARLQADTARQNEVQLRRQAVTTLNELELERAGELFAAADTSRALAYLADILRRNPTNQVAADRALSALIHQQRAAFLTQPLEHQGEVVSAHFSADGQRVVTASLDKTSRVWDVETGRPLTASLRHDGPVRSAQFSPNSRRVLTASDDETARIWDALTGKPVSGPLRHEHLMTGAHFSADGSAVLTFSADGTARVWQTETGQPLTGLLKHEGRIAAAEFSRDGRWVVTASQDETARVWKVQTGEALTRPLQHHGQVVAASFSPDGGRVATASYDKSARIWDTQTGEPVTGPLLHEDGIVSVEFSPDGNRVATASWDKSARIWNARTGQPLTQRLLHQDGVVSAKFSSDGRRIVTASWDRSARVWDVATGQPMTEALSHRDRVLAAEFSPDGQRVVTAGADGCARVWEVPLASLPVPEWAPRLMEAVAAKRFNEQGVFESVSPEVIATLKQELAANSATNDWTRCARWLFADPSTRTISPFSSIRLGDYVEHLMEGATQDRSQEAIARLQEAVRLAPKNGRALVSLVRAILSASPTPERALMAEWYSRRAIKLLPDEPDTWRARGELFNGTGRFPEAWETIEAGLAIHPHNPELWYDLGRMLARTNRLQEAYASLSKAIDFARAKGAQPSRALPAFYLSRSYLLSRQGHYLEAAADFRQAKDIPPRDPTVGPGLIDLSLYYNVSLGGGNWHAGPPLDSSPDWAAGYDLSEVPRGLHKLAGVEFDIRGAIQVGGPTRTGEFHPAKIAGIVVGLPCRRLHFLHSAIYGAAGGTIGKYVVHFQNGQSAEIPLILGRDLTDWVIQNGQPHRQLQIAWKGTETRYGGSSSLCLTKTNWENSSPDLVVSTIDFEASQPEGFGGFPFLVALTAE